MRILAALKFEPRLQDGSIVCVSPTWRSDIQREVDLIEEVARVYGYDKISTRRRIQIEAKPADARQKLSEAIGSFLNGCGYYETVNVTFVDRAVADLFAPKGRGTWAFATSLARPATCCARRCWARCWECSRRT